MAREKKQTDYKVNNIAELIKTMAKSLGPETIKYGNTVVRVQAIPTGIPTLDLALGCGGLPRGRYIEVFGAESGGKTTTTLNIIANCQKTFFKEKDRYGVVAFIDAEHALDLEWAQRIGVDVDKLLVSQPDYGEEAFSIAEALIESELVDLIVIDSVAGLTPKAIIEGDMNDNSIGALPRLMSKSLPKLVGKMAKSGTTVILINQIREKIGVMYGSPETTPGGRALKFFASVRMEIKRTETVKSGDISIANNIRAKIVKNKVAPPFKTAEYAICFGTEKLPIYGVDPVGCLFKAAKEYELIDRKGSNYYFDGKMIGAGEDKCIAAMREDIGLYNRIHDALLSQSSKNINIIDDGEFDGDSDFSELDEDDINP